MQKIAVIGAGQMGTGIAQTVAAHAMPVLLSDV
ncbi:MAG: 3-hydroxyacyl-CoA dehydrogenase NAD-binding domain-containing protein, partial [Pseudomonadota bacterium]